MAERPVIITPKLFKRALKTERVLRPKREKVAPWPPIAKPKPTPPKR